MNITKSQTKSGKQTIHRGLFRKIIKGGQKWNVADFGGGEGGGAMYKEVCFAYLMLGGSGGMLPWENSEI